MPGQRSGFAICDILDLNNSNSEPKIGDNNQQTTSTSSTTSSPLTPNSTTSSLPTSRNSTTGGNTINSGNAIDDSNTHLSRHGFIGSSPYQLPANINTAMLESAGHYHSMFPSAAAKSWFHDHENYGELNFMY